jgi:hypothetical protein
MGGTTFMTTMSATEPVDVAFARAVEQAAWEHGHGGYTGTIAEKHGYVLFTIPSGLTTRDVMELLRKFEENAWARDEDKVPVVIPPGLDLARMFQVYDDKWGPAVAFRSEDSWVFCGWASC